MRKVLQFIYTLGFTLGFLIGWPYIAWRLWRRGHVWKNLGQRFGIYPAHIKKQLQAGTDFWIHAVSVGEVMIAEVLLRQLRAKNPQLRVALTTTTATGYRLAQRLADENTVAVYNPFDFPWVVRKAFDTFQPKIIVLVEAELWPHMLLQAQERKIPVYLVNARLSQRTQARYERWRSLARHMLELVDLVFTQHPEDLERFARAGFPPERLFNIGSLKYDVAALPAPREANIDEWWSRTGWNSNDPVLLAGSTHPGEEEFFLEHFPHWKQHQPNLRLLLAPRHAERARAIQALAKTRGIDSQLRSAFNELLANQPPSVLILDTTGELKALYAKATVVFIGKTLRAHGGQNFIEAARAGTPVVVGPHLENFQQLAAAFCSGDGLLQVTDEPSLVETITILLDAPEKRKALAENARRIFESNRGAGERTTNILLQARAAQGERA